MTRQAISLEKIFEKGMFSEQSATANGFYSRQAGDFVIFAGNGYGVFAEI